MDQFYVTTNESCNICKHFIHTFITYVITHLCFYTCCIDVLNSLKMIKIDRNISELRYILCKKIYNFYFDLHRAVRRNIFL